MGACVVGLSIYKCVVVYVCVWVLGRDRVLRLYILLLLLVYIYWMILLMLLLFDVYLK